MAIIRSGYVKYFRCNYEYNMCKYTTTTTITTTCGCTTTNRHGVAAFDFATVSGCDQLVVGPTHARGGTLDLLLTDVPDIVQVSL